MLERETENLERLESEIVAFEFREANLRRMKRLVIAEMVFWCAVAGGGILTIWATL